MQPADCGERERKSGRKKINFRPSGKKKKKKQLQWKLIERAVELSFSATVERWSRSVRGQSETWLRPLWCRRCSRRGWACADGRTVNKEGSSANFLTSANIWGWRGRLMVHVSTSTQRRSALLGSSVLLSPFLGLNLKKETRATGNLDLALITKLPCPVCRAKPVDYLWFSKLGWALRADAGFRSHSRCCCGAAAAATSCCHFHIHNSLVLLRLGEAGLLCWFLLHIPAKSDWTGNTLPRLKNDSQVANKFHGCVRGNNLAVITGKLAVL